MASSGSSDMRRILESVGAENSVISNFEAQDITKEVVPTLSDTQLIHLGLTTLGKRQLIRPLCRNSSSGNASATRAAVNAAFGYPQQQQQQQSCQNNSPAQVADVVSEARALVQSLSASNRTGSSRFAAQGTSRKNPGKYGLPFGNFGKSTAGKSKGKAAPPRVHQKRVVVLDHREHNDEVYSLSDVMVLVDGNIRYQGNHREIQIRQKIIELMHGKEFLMGITVDDFDFVRVCNKKVRKPDGNVPFDALGVNTVYLTGAIYARLRKAVNLVFMVTIWFQNHRRLAKERKYVPGQYSQTAESQ